jgi:hypothetical protein
MALCLYQMEVRAVVDRMCEWGTDGKERPLQTILRGIIVKVDGDRQQEEVKGLYVCFGPKDSPHVKTLADKVKAVEVTINGVTVQAFPIQARELNLVYDADSRPAKDAWARIFQIPTNVGMGFENRNAKTSRRRKTLDPLALTPGMGDAPVKDEIKVSTPVDEE